MTLLKAKSIGAVAEDESFRQSAALLSREEAVPDYAVRVLFDTPSGELGRAWRWGGEVGDRAKPVEVVRR